MIRFYEQSISTGINIVRMISPKLAVLLENKRVVLRYLASGTTAAATNIASLYILTDVLHVYYLMSSVLAFLISFAVSFYFQKYFTFQDHSAHNVHKQAFTYLIITLLNLGLNTLMVYLFVEYIHFHYLFAQISAGVLVAIESFFIYRIFVFK